MPINFYNRSNRHVLLIWGEVCIIGFLIAQSPYLSLISAKIHHMTQNPKVFFQLLIFFFSSLEGCRFRNIRSMSKLARSKWPPRASWSGYDIESHFGARFWFLWQQTGTELWLFRNGARFWPMARAMFQFFLIRVFRCSGRSCWGY